jgi:predicted GTPase
MSRVNILILGRIGSGKTSLLRYATGDLRFEPSEQISTKSCEVGYITINGETITIIDTPGLDNRFKVITDKSLNTILNKDEFKINCIIICLRINKTKNDDLEYMRWIARNVPKDLRSKIYFVITGVSNDLSKKKLYDSLSLNIPILLNFNNWKINKIQVFNFINPNIKAILSEEGALQMEKESIRLLDFIKFCSSRSNFDTRLLQSNWETWWESWFY